MCGELSPSSGHTGFAPHRGVCAFPVYTAQLPAALYGAGPALCAVPVFRSSTKARIRLRLRFVPSPASAVQAARGLTGALSLGAARPLPSAAPASISKHADWVPAACVCSQELASSLDLPGSGC